MPTLVLQNVHTEYHLIFEIYEVKKVGGV